MHLTFTQIVNSRRNWVAGVEKGRFHTRVVTTHLRKEEQCEDVTTYGNCFEAFTIADKVPVKHYYMHKQSRSFWDAEIQIINEE